MNKNIQNFIEENIDLINQDTKESWEKIYDDFNSLYTGKFTEIMLESGIDPIEKLDQVPSFYLDNSNIIEYIIPSNIKDIKRCAFQVCQELKNIEISEGVQYISEYVFFQCTKLNKIYLPSSLKYIGDHAFDQCYSLDYIEYGGTKEQWKDKMLREDTWRVNTFIRSIKCKDGWLKI